jgi:hypothetical protein
MKTLEMLSQADANGKNYVYQDEYTAIIYSKKKGLEGFTGEGWFYSNIHMPLSTIDKFLNLDGWKEVVKVSDDEKVILRNLKGEWLAKDYDGELCCYTIKPEKNGTTWYGEDDYSTLSALDHLFQMVKWEDEEPTLIADLLKG